MRKINTDSWEEYAIEDLFDVITKTAKQSKYDKYKQPEGDYIIPALSSQAINNSHGFYVRKEDHNVIDRLCLSVTSNGNAGKLFVQTKPFAIAQDAYAIYLKDDKNSLHIYKYLAVVIEEVLINRYGFDEKATWRKVKNERIPLPTKNNQPDWEYMENYITEKQEEAKERLQQLQSIPEKRNELDISGWEEYELNGILPQIKRGTRIKKNNRTEGSIPLITAGNINQGIAGYIEKNEELFTKNSITVDMFGNAFFRDYIFFADDNIIVFKNDNLNTKQLLFINVALQYLTQIFDYRNQFRIASIDNLKIKLPTKNNQPDWEYMENYITQKQAEVQEKLRGLRDE